MQDNGSGNEGVPGASGEISGGPEVGAVPVLQGGRHFPAEAYTAAGLFEQCG